jgi:hypothetical protein
MGAGWSRLETNTIKPFIAKQGHWVSFSTDTVLDRFIMLPKIISNEEKMIETNNNHFRSLLPT